MPALRLRIAELLALDLPIDRWIDESSVDPEMLSERILAASEAAMQAKASQIEAASWRSVEKNVLLQSLDHHWKEHLATLDALRQVIHLRAYAQKTPINEYKQEAFALFERMLIAIREDVTRMLSHAQLNPAPAPEMPAMPGFVTSHLDPFSGEDDTMDLDGGKLGLVTTRIPQMPLSLPEAVADDLSDDPASWAGRVSRNAPCPCGSGQKYKHCHGATV